MGILGTTSVIRAYKLGAKWARVRERQSESANKPSANIPTVLKGLLLPVTDCLLIGNVRGDELLLLNLGAVRANLCRHARNSNHIFHQLCLGNGLGLFRRSQRAPLFMCAYEGFCGGSLHVAVCTAEAGRVQRTQPLLEKAARFLGQLF